MSKTLQQPEPMIGTHLADGETGQGFAQMLCFDSFWAMSPLGANVMDGIASPPNTSMSSPLEPMTMTFHGKGGAVGGWSQSP